MRVVGRVESRQKKKEKIRDINKFHAKQLAYLLTKLKSIPDGDGTLLDHPQAGRVHVEEGAVGGDE